MKYVTLGKLFILMCWVHTPRHHREQLNVGLDQGALYVGAVTEANLAKDFILQILRDFRASIRHDQWLDSIALTIKIA